MLLGLVETFGAGAGFGAVVVGVVVVFGVVDVVVRDDVALLDPPLDRPPPLLPLASATVGAKSTRISNNAIYRINLYIRL